MINAYFEDIESTIINEIKTAQTELNIAVAWISFDIFNPVLLDLVNKGVKVTILCHNDYINKNNTIDKKLQKNKLFKFEKIKMPFRRLMHNKFLIIDEKTVVTGSYNLSMSASNHFENIVIIKNEAKVIYDFLLEFKTLETINDLYPLKKNIKCDSCKNEMITLGILQYDENYNKNFVNDVDIYTVFSQ